MKIYIVTDLEGPAGVDSWRQTRVDDAAEKLGAMRLLTGEVNAAIRGIRDVDSSAAITVWDGHGSGGIIAREILPDVRFIAHQHDQSMPEFDGSFDALMFVGQHAMAGTAEAPLCHTYSSETVESYTLNGQRMGEFGCRAALAGELGIPAIFISGDDKACIEASELVANIVTAQTKVGLGIEAAHHLSPQASQELIRRQAAIALRHRGQIAALRISAPYVLRIVLIAGCAIEQYLKRGASVIDDRTVEFKAPRMGDLPV
jgi:D-amino peptidase